MHHSFILHAFAPKIKFILHGSCTSEYELVLFLLHICLIQVKEKYKYIYIAMSNIRFWW